MENLVYREFINNLLIITFFIFIPVSKQYCQNSIENLNVDFSKSLYDEKETLELIKKGDSDGYLRLGVILVNKKTKEEIDEGIKYLKISSEKGNEYAQLRLGQIYTYGKIVKKDPEIGFYWVKRCAEQGFAYGQEFLSTLYLYGMGTLKDPKKAFEWMKKSAEQSNPQAQYFLAVYYETGMGTVKDKNEAAFWFKESAENGYEKAYWPHAKNFIDLDAKKFFYWTTKSAEFGNEEAQYFLGHMYFLGEGTLVDKYKAAFWTKKSYENGYEKAGEIWKEYELWKYQDRD